MSARKVHMADSESKTSRPLCGATAMKRTLLATVRLEVTGTNSRALDEAVKSIKTRGLVERWVYGSGYSFEVRPGRVVSVRPERKSRRKVSQLKAGRT